MGTELLDALTVLENEKGIDKDFIIEALEAALESAYKRNFDQAQNVRVDINQTTGSMHVFAQKKLLMRFLIRVLKLHWSKHMNITVPLMSEIQSKLK